MLAAAGIWMAATAAHAGDAPVKPEASAKAGRAVTAKGVQNSRKVMLHAKEKYQRVSEVKKRGHAQKEQGRRKP